MRDSSTLSTPVARFADALLGADLPALDDDRRLATVAFIERRVATLPSITRFGVLVIGTGVSAMSRLVGSNRVLAVITSRPIPLLGDYPRLVRSLGYAYIWENWPDTSADGATADVGAT